jgi:hypothetical protein
MANKTQPRKFDLKRAARYVMDSTKRIIETYGPREPGGESERKAQDSILEELKQYSDEARIEPFTLAPKAFLGFLPVATTLLIASALAYAKIPMLAFALSCTALGVILLEFVLYRQFLDPFFPKRTSHNVYAIRKAYGKSKRRIILSGHVDSAYEMRYNLIGRSALMIAGALGAISMIYLLFLNTTNILLGVGLEEHFGNLWRILELGRFAILPISILSYTFTRFSVLSPGANDNLTGVFAVISIMKHMGENDARFEHTDLACLITGSEEAGLRGAKAFVKANNEELHDKETVVLALDTLRDPEHLAIYNRDMNGTVKHHPSACERLLKLGEKRGLKLQFESVYLGASDAAAFTQAGIPSAAIGGMDPSPPRYYHTRLDNWDNMNEQCIMDSIALAMDFVEEFDQNGLDSNPD